MDSFLYYSLKSFCSSNYCNSDRARKTDNSITVPLVRRAITLWGAIEKTTILRKSTKDDFVIQ